MIKPAERLLFNFGTIHLEKQISVKLGSQNVGMEHVYVFFPELKRTYVFISKTTRDISALVMTFVNINRPTSEIRSYRGDRRTRPLMGLPNFS